MLTEQIRASLSLLEQRHQISSAAMRSNRGLRRVHGRNTMCIAIYIAFEANAQAAQAATFLKEQFQAQSKQVRIGHSKMVTVESMRVERMGAVIVQMVPQLSLAPVLTSAVLLLLLLRLTQPTLSYRYNFKGAISVVCLMTPAEFLFFISLCFCTWMEWAR